jgi:chromosome segregation ATPase
MTNNMEITQAKIILTNLIKSQTDEFQATQLALDLLNETFKADFVSLETAQKEADDGAAKLSVINTSLEQVTADRDSQAKQVADLTLQVTDVQSQLDDVTTQLTDLQTQVQTATTVDDLTNLQTTLANRITPPQHL